MTNYPFVVPRSFVVLNDCFDFAGAMNKDAFHDILTRINEDAIAGRLEDRR